ncbi:MAG: FAD-dependent oxidoreductase, partial [Solirubrobacterales bacterium]
MLPGISGKWNGRATIDHWAAHPWTKGSYSYWKVGQYMGFAGAERERSGNCHFAGEHRHAGAGCEALLSRKGAAHVRHRSASPASPHLRLSRRSVERRGCGSGP